MNGALLKSYPDTGALIFINEAYIIAMWPGDRSGSWAEGEFVNIRTREGSVFKVCGTMEEVCRAFGLGNEEESWGVLGVQNTPHREEEKR